MYDPYQMTHGNLLIEEWIGEASVTRSVEQVQDGGLVAANVPDAEADQKSQE